MKERLKQLRAARGVSQKEMADRLNVKQATVSLWEKGTRQPSRTALAVIAREFGVSLEWLIDGSCAMDSTPPTDDAEDPLLHTALDVFRRLPKDAQKTTNKVLQQWLDEGRFNDCE